MAQYKVGTVDVTYNSTTITGNGTNWTSALEDGIFKVEGVSADFVIDTVVSTTEITLATNYTGSTDTEVAYNIVQDLTTNYDFREIHQGDKEWAYHVTETFRLIDAQIKTLNDALP